MTLRARLDVYLYPVLRLESWERGRRVGIARSPSPPSPSHYGTPDSKCRGCRKHSRIGAVFRVADPKLYSIRPQKRIRSCRHFPMNPIVASRLVRRIVLVTGDSSLADHHLGRGVEAFLGNPCQESADTTLGSIFRTRIPTFWDALWRGCVSGMVVSKSPPMFVRCQASRCRGSVLGRERRRMLWVMRPFLPPYYFLFTTKYYAPKMGFLASATARRDFREAYGEESAGLRLQPT